MPKAKAVETAKKDSPANTGQAHDRQQEAVTICRDVYAGTLLMRTKGSTYLPQFPKEIADAYASRLSQSVLFNAFKRTVGGLVGMIFRKDPQPTEEVPDLIESIMDDIDLQGRHFAVFSRDAFTEAMIDGHVCVLVDYPSVEEGEVPTLADERSKGLRPYWLDVRKQQILSFRTRQEQGRTVLTQVAIEFTTTEEDGKFGEKEVVRIRVYRLQDALGEQGDDARYVAWEEWVKKEKETRGGENYAMEKEGRLSIPEIPLVPIYVNRTDYFESEPSLLDLSLENIKHYQARSDQDNALHIARIPIPVFVGLEEEVKITVGPNTGITLPIGGKASYMEPEGKALEHGRKQIMDIEQHMAALGLAMLQRQTRAAETAQAKMIDKSESDSALAAAARGLEDGLNECLRLTALWMKLDNGGKVNVNFDFMDQQMDAQMIDVLSKMVAQEYLTLQTLWELLIAGEILPDTFDPEEELERLEEASDAQMAVMQKMFGKKKVGEGGTTQEGQEGETGNIEGE